MAALTTVRSAVPGDASALSRFGAMTFRDAFADNNAPEDMALYIAEAFTPERQAAEIADPDCTVLVAERQGTSGEYGLVGYVHLVSGPAPEAVADPASLELKRLYVAREWHGRGVAQALMDAALDSARARGARAMWLGVWERNDRAVAFYRKYGFTKAGEHAFLLGTDREVDWVLVRSLDQAPTAEEV